MSAEKYDGALDDIFELQDRITEQVAGALQPSIQSAEIERSRRKRPQVVGAYDYTMRALPQVWMLEEDEATKALSLLDEALPIDPDVPTALALAAWFWALRLSPLDPINFNNHVGIASAHPVACDDNAAADIFIRALEERPHAYWIHRDRAPALLAAGRLGESRISCDALLESYPRLTIARFRKAMVFSPRVLERISALLLELGIPRG